MILIGIVNPIEAKVRKGKGAVGAYGNERTQQSLQDFPVVDSEEEEEKVYFKQYMLFNLVAECVFICVSQIYCKICCTHLTYRINEISVLSDGNFAANHH